MKRNYASYRMALRVLTIVIITGLLSTQLLDAQWYNTSWQYRVPISVDNTVGGALTNYQVLVTLSNSFDWANTNNDGSDIRLTSSDGVTEISYWIESWNDGTSARIWVEVPSVTAGTTTTVYLYYGNAAAQSASNGANTFEFFDDFETPSTTYDYYTLSSPGTTILVQDQAWENSAPHTLDVVDWGYEKDGYRYWGYYGLQAYPQGDGVGLARSNDLATWTKYVSNPVINVDNARWPSVLLVGSTLHIFYTDYTGGNSTIVRETSSDGINFTTNKTLVVRSETGIYNGSPDLFIGPGGTYYLYWVRIIGSTHQIMARSASSLDGLASAENIYVLTSATTLAAPDMMYYGGKYFLACEVAPSVWETYGWVSTTSPVSGFTPIHGNPILGNGSACYSQHIYDNTLHTYYAKETGGIWTMEHRSADITQSLQPYYSPDASKWTASGGAWNIVSTAQQNGITGNVIHGITSAYQILNAAFTGTDYILEGYGSQVSGDEWGLGFRVADMDDYFTINLYNNNDAGNNLYLYNFVGGVVSEVTGATAALGAINLNTWYKVTIKAHGSNFDAYAYYNDNILGGITNASSTAHSAGGVALFGENGTNAYFNDLRVRKYAAIEPSNSIGTAQNQSSVLIINYIKSDVSCYGGNDGQIDITVPGDDGSYTYLWSPGGQTEPDIDGLVAGTYSVHVEDPDMGKVGDKSITVSQPEAALSLGYSITGQVNCNNSKATVVITATGGTAPYSGTGSFQQSIGTTVYNVYDAHNCQESISVTIDPSDAWFDSNWLYRIPVTITNPGSTLSGYQVKVSLDGSFPGWSHAKSDGSDIRFTASDGSTILPYWIESWTPSSSGTIWVKANTVAAGTTTIYLYYGNAGATSASNGSTTFEFFDDFEGVTVPDPSKWTASGGAWNIVTVTQQNGITGNVVQGITTGFQILSSFYSGNDYILEACGSQVSGSEWGLGFRVENNQNYFTTNLYNVPDRLYLYNWVNGGADIVTNVVAGTIDLNTWYKMTVKAHGSSFDVYVDDVLRINNASSSSHSSGGVALFGELGTNAYFNDLRVRKYAANEPSASIGNEEFTSQWFGTISNDWNNLNNWTNGIPTNCSRVTISSEPLRPLHITNTSPANCYILTIPVGFTVTIDAGAELTVSGNLINDGSLTIESTSLNSSGSLIAGASSGTGTVTYKRQMRPDDRHYFSSPVGGQSKSDFKTNNPDVSKIWVWDEDNWYGADESWYDSTGVGNFTMGRGYNLEQTEDDGLFIFTGSVRNSASMTATSPYITDVVDNTETEYNNRWLNSPRYSTGLWGGGGWNLLGNPFTSALRITDSDGDLTNDFLNVNTASFDPNYVAVYLYDGNAIRYYFKGKSTGFTDPITGEDPQNQTFSFDNIQAGQGFFVLAMKDGVPFNFDRSMQTHGTGTTLLKSAIAEGDSWPGIKLKVKYGDKENSTLVVYNENMTVGLDAGYDVGQLSASPDVEIYSVLIEKDNGVNFARQALPLTDCDKNIVPIGIDSKTGGEVIFSAYTVPIGSYKFWLEDRLKGTYTNLNTNTYTVTLPNNTYGTGRFFIIASANTPTGIQQPQAENTGVRVWTSNDKVIIKGEVSDRAICTVYDLRGQKILETRLADGELNTVTLPSGLHGVYLVRVSDGVKVTTRKVALL